MSRHARTMSLLAFLGMFFVSSRSSRLPAEEVSPSDFFKSAYRTQRVERDKIRTWKGTIHCREKTSVADPPQDIVEKVPSWQRVFREMKFDSSFLVDASRSRLFSTLQPIAKINFLDAEGRVLAHSDERGYNSRTLITDRTFTLRPWQAPGRQKGDPSVPGWKASKSRVIEESPRRNAASRAVVGDILDPLRLFDPPGDDFIGYLQLLSEATDATYFRGLNLRREKSPERDVFVWGSGEPRARFEAEYHVGKHVGFHLLSYRLYDRKQGILVCKVDVTYTRVANVIVPSKYEMQKMSEDGSHLQVGRSYELSDQVLNQPLDEQVFSMKHLGAQPGDRVIDQQAAALRLVNGDFNIVPVADFEKEYSNGFEDHSAEAK